MNGLLPEVGSDQKIVAKITNFEKNESEAQTDYQTDIELCMPERFYPKLSKEEIESLETPFCVDNMENSRCFSSHKRSIRVIKKYRDLYGLKEGYTLYDIIEAFKGKKMYVVRRDLDENGNKIDNKYVMVEGTVVNIEPMYGDEYEFTNLIMNFNDPAQDERTSINRVFFKICS